MALRVARRRQRILTGLMRTHVTLPGCVSTLRKDHELDDRRLLDRLMPAQQCPCYRVDLVVVGAVRELHAMLDRREIQSTASTPANHEWSSAIRSGL